MCQTGAGYHRKIIISFRRNRMSQERNNEFAARIFLLHIYIIRQSFIRSYASINTAVGWVASLTIYICGGINPAKLCMQSVLRRDLCRGFRRNVEVNNSRRTYIPVRNIGCFRGNAHYVCIICVYMYCVKCFSRPTTQARITNTYVLQTVATAPCYGRSANSRWIIYMYTLVVPL